MLNISCEYNLRFAIKCYDLAHSHILGYDGWIQDGKGEPPEFHEGEKIACTQIMSQFL